MKNTSNENTDLIVELSAAAGGLAHEIRNVLSTLRMNLQLLDEDWGHFEQKSADASPDSIDLSRRSRKRVGTLLKESRRLESILENFLQFISKKELKLEAADLNQAMAELVEFFRPQADAANIDLNFEAAEVPLPCRFDANLMKQAVLNLLINAQNAMADGGRLSVRLGRSPEGSAATIVVSDTGPGIPEDQKRRIFDAYFSTKKGGTGLGLTMARQIIHEHGGRILLSSPSGQGSQFTITLPLAP